MKKRILRESRDTFAIDNLSYNDETGARKVIVVEPVVKIAVSNTDTYPEGSLVKVTGTSYTLQLLNKAFSAGASYLEGQTVTQGGRIYEAQQAISPAAFNAAQWFDMAAASIGPVSIVAGAVVSCGKFHNNVGAAGFLVADESIIA